MAGPFAFLRQRFGVGNVPPALRARLEPEGIIAVAERVKVRQRFSGSVPGTHAALSVTRHRGLVVLTQARIYALIPTLARLKEPAIDQLWTAGLDHGPARVTVDELGLTLDVALKRVDQRFGGDLTTTWKCDFGTDVLAALPARSLSFAVTPAYVFSSLGVRVRP